MRSFFRKLSWLTRRRRKEDELREELQFHLEEEAEQQRAEGLAAEQARWAARRDLGNVALLKEDARAAWGWTLLEQFGQDVRYAFRTMRTNKAFTALAALSLALGIGANTAIYSFMDALLLRSLPVEDPGSLVMLNWHIRGVPFPKGSREPATVVYAMSGSIYDDGKAGSSAGILPSPHSNFSRRTIQHSLACSHFGKRDGSICRSRDKLILRAVNTFPAITFAA